MLGRLATALAELMLMAAGSGAMLGCELLSTVDRGKIDGDAGGQGGEAGSDGTTMATGGTMKATGGSGGAGGSGGTGGTGGSSCDPSQCPGADTECQWRACIGDVCGFTAAASGTPLSAQTAGDCATAVCDGDGGTTTIPEPADVLDDRNPCTVDTCGPGGPTSTPSAPGTACSDGGNGKQCDGGGACVECLAGSDCASAVCMAGLCVPATCADFTTNGAETDIDCGGGTCPACADGQACAGAADCQSGACVGSICQAVICGDGVTLGPEQCDDQNMADGDGCSSACVVEAGYTCMGAPSVCGVTCGDGVVAGAEACDDQNVADGDGCSSACAVEAGYACAGAPLSACAPICGDGLKLGSEQCDDSNTADGDCCSSACQIESAGCEIEPNDDAAQADENGAFPLGTLLQGSIAVDGDEDWFAIDLTTVSDLKLETFDGAGPSSCVGVDTILDLYAADGTTLLATDDDTGPAACSLIDPNPAATIPNPATRHLVPGTYYALVRKFSGTLPAYTLRVTATSVCGNGVIDPNSSEACDDGNLGGGDGCSGLCRLEPSSVEAEPNGTCAQANGPFPITMGAGKLVGGAISPAADGDWWAFTVPAHADVRLETFDATGPVSCEGIDTQIRAYGADCVTPLGPIKDNGGVGLCSRLNPTFDLFMRRLAPGTYHVNVTPKSASATFDYTLLASLTALCGDGVLSGSEQCDDGDLTGGDGCEPDCRVTPVCGDDIKSGAEQCDDGNTVGGDGCSPTCQWETVAEVEPNGTLLEAGTALPAITGSTNLTGAIMPSGDLDLFRLDVAAQTTIRAEVFDSSGSDCTGMTTMALRLHDSGGVQLKQDAPDAVASGISVCPALVFSVPAGTYYIQAQKSTAGTIAAYFLEVRFLSDLGGEIEPNELSSEATQVTGRNVVVAGGHSIGADSDYYEITLPSWTKSIRAEVIEGDPSETCESLGMDSFLTLFDAGGTPLVLDEDDGRGRCSAIDGTGAIPRDGNAHDLAAGTYYLQVKASSFATANGAMFDYRLALTVR